MRKRATPWLRVRVPAIPPAYLEIEPDTFADSGKATTAQWRIAASKLQQLSLSESERDLVLRPACQMVSIADALGVPDDAALLPALRARTASNVVSLRKVAPASLADLHERRPAPRERWCASIDEGAVARAREMLAQDPTLIGFELWDGSRNVAEERRRAGVSLHPTRAPAAKRRDRHDR